MDVGASRNYRLVSFEQFERAGVKNLRISRFEENSHFYKALKRRHELEILSEDVRRLRF